MSDLFMLTDHTHPPPPTDIPTELYQIKVNISALTTTVRDHIVSSSEEMTEMRKIITDALLKISESTAVMATCNERIIHNTNEHTWIHKRIDTVENNNSDQQTTLQLLKEDVDKSKITHAFCVSNNKREEDRKKNSPFTLAWNKVIEYAVVVVVALIAFTLIMHAKSFIDYANPQATTSPIAK